jgi:hypothetical protein
MDVKHLDSKTILAIARILNMLETGVRKIPARRIMRVGPYPWSSFVSIRDILDFLKATGWEATYHFEGDPTTGDNLSYYQFEKVSDF